MNQARTELATAADVVRAEKEGLSRYKRANAQRIELRGTLEDVSTIPDDMIWLAIRNVDGLQRNDLVTATMPTPGAHIDRLLKDIGPAGKITIVAVATCLPDTIAKLRLTRIETINEIDVNQPPHQPGGQAGRLSDG